jgi:hypothetical protein
MLVNAEDRLESRDHELANLRNQALGHNAKTEGVEADLRRQLAAMKRRADAADYAGRTTAKYADEAISESDELMKLAKAEIERLQHMCATAGAKLLRQKFEPLGRDPRSLTEQEIGDAMDSFFGTDTKAERAKMAEAHAKFEAEAEAIGNNLLEFLKAQYPDSEVSMMAVDGNDLEKHSGNDPDCVGCQLVKLIRS